MMKRVIFGLLALGMLVGAVGLLAQTKTIEDVLKTYTFKSIHEIVEGDLTVSNFASDGTASLSVTTSVPVACSIVYGTTPEFGKLAVDLTMNGGTQTEHNPILTDLESETTYYYRFQGTDDNGVVYLSEVMTFTTPPRTDAANTNLASPELGAEIVGYSSAYGGAAPDARWGVMSALDGSQNSAWSSAGDGDKAWFEVKLAQPSHINQILYWSRSMSDGTSRVLQFHVITDAGRTYGPFDVPDTSQAYTFDVDFEASSVRFEVVKSSGGNTGAVEFGVYGTALKKK